MISTHHCPLLWIKLQLPNAVQSYKTFLSHSNFLLLFPQKSFFLNRKSKHQGRIEKKETRKTS